MKKAYKNSAAHDHYNLLKKIDGRILFQNSDFDINIGTWLNDPNVEMDEVIWYNILASEMLASILKQEGLISMNEKFETVSCYAELHR